MTSKPPRRLIHPAHAVMLAGTIPLYLGALLSDGAYWSSLQVQWINFASWLNAGALVLTGAVLLWAVIDFVRANFGRNRLGALYLLVVLTTFVLGFINALVHAKDAWAAMPTGLILSVLTFLLAFAAVWLGFSSQRWNPAR